MRTFLIGTFTTGTGSRGIYETTLDARTGALTPPRLFVEAEDPSYLAWDAAQRTLYAACENNDFMGGGSAGVRAFRVSETGIVPAGAANTLGKNACHVLATATEVLVANYLDGKLTVFARTATGDIGARKQVIAFPGHGRDPVNQQCAHAHQTAVVGGEIWVCDLGADCIHRLKRDADGPYISVADIPLPPGTGPRHLLAMPDHADGYVVGELSSRLYHLHEHNGSWRVDAGISCLPEHAGESYCAALRQGTDGRLYVSNRGDDSVAIFALRDGQPQPAEFLPTGGHWPRDIFPAGDYVLCANERGNCVTSVCIQTKKIADSISLPAPVCFLERSPA